YRYVFWSAPSPVKRKMEGVLAGNSGKKVRLTTQNNCQTVFGTERPHASANGENISRRTEHCDVGAVSTLGLNMGHECHASEIQQPDVLTHAATLKKWIHALREMKIPSERFSSSLPAKNVALQLRKSSCSLLAVWKLKTDALLYIQTGSDLLIGKLHPFS
ncbi:hypothetical protein ACJX0J_008989, partial [Zea mays]